MPKFTDEQQRAIDLEGSNILVSAGAGSGKTAVLSERVLRKIKEGVSVDNLLVLTFTNAAAAEMKFRIRDKVGKYPELKEEFLKIESSYITTFDSFTLSIVKKYHYKKMLDKNINITDASILTMEKNKILDNLFDSMYENKDMDFLNLINVYCFKNDKDIKKFIYSAYESINLLFNKEEFLNTYNDRFYSDMFINECVSKYEMFILNKKNNIVDAYNKVSYIDSEYAKKYQLDEFIDARGYDDIYKFYKTPSVRIPNGSGDELKGCNDVFKALLKDLKSYLVYETKEEYKEEILKNKDFVIKIINIIKEFDKLVSEFKYSNNMYDFLDIEKLAIDILKENEDVRLYYKNRFNEILIDEYQDTSDIQEEFVKLIENNNVYMVGDIKQSIYKFRNANPNIFREKFNNYGNSIGGLRIDLNKNFRSREEVLSNINLMFNFLMDDYLGGAHYRLEHQLVFGNNTYNLEGKLEHDNNFEILSYSDEEKKYPKDDIEIFIMLNDILNKVNNNYLVFDKDTGVKRPILYSDIAILIDSSKMFDKIKKIFASKGVNTTIFKDESIKDSINIKLIKNLLILVVEVSNKNYKDNFRYATTSILRSYLFRYSDEEIYKVINEKNYFDNDLYKKVRNISDNIDELSISYVVKKLIEEFSFYDNLIYIGNIIENETVLEYLIELSENNDTVFSIEEFIDYLDNITYGSLDIKYSLSKGDNNSVKIMTIHRSKGLEYPLCYFPNLDKEFNTEDVKKSYLFSNNYGIIMPFINNDTLNNSFLKTIYKDDFLVDDIGERLRLFYVALTRAKEKMIFIMNYENKKDYELVDNIVNNLDRLKYKSFKNFLESINHTVTKYVKVIDIDNIGINKDYNLVKKTNYKTNISKCNIVLDVKESNVCNEVLNNKHFSKSTNKLFTIKEKENMKLGNTIHEIMESIDFNNPILSNVDKKYVSFVESFLNEDILKDTINYYKEYEFIYESDNTLYNGIIDLLLEKDNEYVIIDYKLNDIKDVNYVKQLNGYRNYIENITNKKVSMYLYSIVKRELKVIDTI